MVYFCLFYELFEIALAFFEFEFEFEFF